MVLHLIQQAWTVDNALVLGILTASTRLKHQRAAHIWMVHHQLPRSASREVLQALNRPTLTGPAQMLMQIECMPNTSVNSTLTAAVITPVSLWLVLTLLKQSPFITYLLGRLASTKSKQIVVVLPSNPALQPVLRLNIWNSHHQNWIKLMRLSVTMATPTLLTTQSREMQHLPQTCQGEINTSAQCWGVTELPTRTLLLIPQLMVKGLEMLEGMIRLLVQEKCLEIPLKETDRLQCKPSTNQSAELGTST